MKRPGLFFKTEQPQGEAVLPQNAVFIIGMHRSGTSALGGVLEALGLTVGKSVMRAGPDNPKGFSENVSLQVFHDAFLATARSSWDDPKPLGDAPFRGKSADRFREKLLQLLKREFPQGRPLIKDPRLCRLMPLWIPLIQENFPRACFILPLRHPVEVACSLRQRNRIALDQGLKLWAVHELEGERTTRGFCRFFTTYDQLTRSPAETVLNVAGRVGLPQEGVASASARRIDPTMRHQTKSAWPAGEPHEELTLAIYETLRGGEAAKEEKLDRLRQEYYGKMGWGC